MGSVVEMINNREALIRQLHSRAITTPELTTNTFVTGETFDFVDLSRLQLRNAVFDGCVFIKCCFDLTMVQGASFQHAKFDGCHFQGADATTGVTILAATILNSTFSELYGDWKFSNCKLTSCAFTKLECASVVFDRQTELTACDIAAVDIEQDHDALVRASATAKFVPWPEVSDSDEEEDDDDDDDDDDDEVVRVPPS